MTTHSAIFYRKSLLLIILCLALLPMAGCKRSKPDVANVFPASNEVTGWSKTGEVRTFPAADLWKYIDGDAERYLKAGVDTTRTADYKFNDKSDAVVDIFTMTSSEGAAQIFDSEPAAGSDSVKLGDSARLYGQSLVFRKKAYLVRITAYENTKETQAALLALGHGLEQRLAN